MDSTIVGSLRFTSIGAQKWKLIFSKITLNELITMIDSKSRDIETVLSDINGIGSLTAKTILNEYPLYRDDLIFISSNIRYKNTKSLGENTGKQIRFSGCRNLQLVEQVSKLGADISGESGVTKNTDILIVPYKGFTSTKTSKVSSKCMIIPVDDFKSNVEYYLSK